MQIGAAYFVGQTRSRTPSDTMCLSSSYCLLPLAEIGHISLQPPWPMYLEQRDYCHQQKETLPKKKKITALGSFSARPVHSKPRDEQEPRLTLSELPDKLLLMPSCTFQKTSLVGIVPPRLVCFCCFLAHVGLVKIFHQPGCFGLTPSSN